MSATSGIETVIVWIFAVMIGLLIVLWLNSIPLNECLKSCRPSLERTTAARLPQEVEAVGGETGHCVSQVPENPAMGRAQGQEGTGAAGAAQQTELAPRSAPTKRSDPKASQSRLGEVVERAGLSTIGLQMLPFALPWQGAHQSDYREPPLPFPSPQFSGGQGPHKPSHASPPEHTNLLSGGNNSSLVVRVWGLSAAAAG